jgi:hypothetical protein
MEELALNLTGKQVNKLIKDFPVTPTRNRLIITINTVEEDFLQLDDQIAGGLDEVQYVMAQGSHVSSEINPGTKVMLDLDKMSVESAPGVFEIKIDPIKIGDRVYAFVYDSNIKAIDNR